MQVKIDKGKCTGCGACVSVCEECFVMDKDKAKFIGQAHGNKCAKEAAEICPSEAIEINKD